MTLARKLYDRICFHKEGDPSVLKLIEEAIEEAVKRERSAIAEELDIAALNCANESNDGYELLSGMAYTIRQRGTK